MAIPFILGLAGLWVIFLFIEATSPFFFVHDDSAMQLAPEYLHNFRVLAETGRLAEINYFQFGGEPFIEEGHTGVLYPPVYLCAALAMRVMGDVRWIIEFMAFLHLTLGYIGFYFLLRHLNVDRLPAVLGGLAWALNPFVLLLGSSWLAIVMAAAALPWIYWALDRLLLRPSVLSSLVFGSILGFYFLQGAPQWFAYNCVFMAIYLVLRFLVVPQLSFLRVLYSLVLSSLIFLVIALPSLVPTVHAIQVSDQRSSTMPWQAALAGSVLLDYLFKTQFGIFLPRLVFYGSSAILFFPILLFLPLVLIAYFRADEIFRRKLLPFLGLSLVSFAFSTPLHALLNLLPFFDRFRWPFKVFIFVEFFFTVLFVLSLVSWLAARFSSPTRQKWIIAVVLGWFAAVNLIFSLTHHDQNFLSVSYLPKIENPLPQADASVGRVATFGDVNQTVTVQYLTQNYATLYGIPTLGGYNPLMGRDQAIFGLGIVDHAIDYTPVTPELRKQLDSHAAKYWIVDARTPMAAQIATFPDLKLIEASPDRIVYENLRALPLAYSVADSTKPLPVTYAGNSLFIPLDHASSPVAVSLSKTDGWWHRLDDGPWQRSTYEDDHLQIDIGPSSQALEISYFDPYFRQGLIASLGTLVLLVILLGLGRRFFPRP